MWWRETGVCFVRLNHNRLSHNILCPRLSTYTALDDFGPSPADRAQVARSGPHQSNTMKERSSTGVRGGAKAHDVPIEIWHSLVEKFLEPTSKEVKNLILTCRYFRVVFQPMVFSRITLRGEGTISKRRRVLGLTEFFAIRPVFKWRLKQVTLEWPPGVRDHCPATLKLLGNLPDLESLVLKGICIVHGLITQICHLRSLRHLELNNVVICNSWKTIKALKSLNLPALRSLTLRQCGWIYGHSRSWDDLALLAFSPSLTELHLVDLGNISRAMNRLFDSVHHEPLVNLTTLEIAEPPFREDIELFRIGLQCPNVVTLKCYHDIAVMRHAESAPADVVRRAFPRLSDFSGSVGLATRLLPGRSIKVACLISGGTPIRLSEALLASIFPHCNSLRKLGVQSDVWDDNIIVVVGKVLPSLTELTIETSRSVSLVRVFTNNALQLLLTIHQNWARSDLAQKLALRLNFHDLT